MKRVLLVIPFVFIPMFLSACEDKIYTVSEFEANEQLRKDILAKCKNGEKIDPQNCSNAQRAQFFSKELNTEGRNKAF